ncbi:unnamed protein product (macronuclear) [Paramecium tetraurelia]|uniref:CRC domain-containing protein n=1 Tax=Paramecium tetraurelia TaxID=5888 RepID=A0BQU9_PARTE|nr:uncharacterized protein GSPATT00031145001 [Paramecium tetraurelia]CAK60916.1 unnamed protein product [Paramecium tetraurelia]|eukprot:XP_001428314.1 hypothetical protein (macronuclear) [Paramecium tetraurelia strain d4-2]
MNYQSYNNCAGYISSPELPWSQRKQGSEGEFEPQDEQILEETNSKFQSKFSFEEQPIILISQGLNPSASQNSINDEVQPQMMQIEILSPSKLLRTSKEIKSTCSIDSKPQTTSIQEELIVNSRTRRKTSKANYNVDESPTLDSEIKPCHCSKTNCLQLYCSCFHNRRQCTQECKCCDCYNDGQHTDEVLKAVEQIKIKEQRASHHDLDSFDTRQVWGCKCKKTKCVKGYCECFIRNKKCSSHCHCSDCQNKKQKTYQHKKIKKI